MTVPPNPPGYRPASSVLVATLAIVVIILVLLIIHMFV